MPCPKKSPKEIYKRKKIETDKRRKHFFHTFLYLLGEWTNQRYVPRHSVGPKTPDSKIGVVGSTSLPEKEVGSQKTWVFISLHRLQIRHSKILLILARPLSIGYFTFYYFLFSDFNRMDAWSLMRGDAFIHFVSGSRRVNIRLGVFLLIPKSPQFSARMGYVVSWYSHVVDVRSWTFDEGSWRRSSRGDTAGCLMLVRWDRSRRWIQLDNRRGQLRSVESLQKAEVGRW